MELNPRQRNAVFAVIVVVLAGLGASLFLPHGTSGAGKSHRSAGSYHAGTPGPTGSPGTPASPAPPSSRAAPSSSAHVNIYQWLPFSEQDLARAAAVTTRFAGDYDTFSYRDSPAAYMARMNGLVSGELAQTLKNGYQTSGVAQLRSSQKQVSSATATIGSMRTFGPSSITFVVTISQRLSGTHGASDSSTQYAVTVARSGGSWQVNDIELASAGNQ